MARKIETKPRNRVYKRKFDWDEARKLRAEGWTYPDLAAHFGVSIRTVRYVCIPSEYEKMREVTSKRQRSGTCPDCGNPMSFNPSDQPRRCVRCHAESVADVNDRVAKCVICQEWKPHEDFLLQPGKYIDRRGLRPSCRSCNTRIRREHRAANAEKELLKSRAYHAVRRAVKNGEMTKPEVCQNCGGRHKIQAHHEDHTRPLDVLWLCDHCHRGHHSGKVVLNRDIVEA